MTLAEATASCVAMNMTLLSPEDLSILPQYFNMLKSKELICISPKLTKSDSQIFQTRSRAVCGRQAAARAKGATCSADSRGVRLAG